ncbi:MAG TPA: lipase family protein [Xanthobacteraceae bacterium]|nr:lipase family protein [Xanthobacteraceae bacterium]
MQQRSITPAAHARGRNSLRCKAAAAAFAAALFASPAFANQYAFYDVTAAELRGRAGTIIRAEAFPGAPAGAAAYKILYRSTNPKGEPIAVSGLIVVPQGPPPAGGRRVVAWAHGTTGVARKCAPSLFPQSLTWIPGLANMLARGYVVAATDYPGLGTAGVHPYLIGESEARAVLDSVRAARNLDGTGASEHFAVWGHSQGGHATLFSGILARRYAPELRLAGVAAAAPATELGELFRADIRGPTGKVLGAFALWSWSNLYKIPLDNVVLERSMLVFERVAGFCNDTPRQVTRLIFAEQPLEREGFLAVDVTKIQPWKRIMDENTPGALPAGVPVFLAQGTADSVVRPGVTAQYMRVLCGKGTPVAFVAVPGGDHDASAEYGAGPAMAWIADRFAGAPPPNNC